MSDKSSDNSFYVCFRRFDVHVPLIIWADVVVADIILSTVGSVKE